MIEAVVTPTRGGRLHIVTPRGTFTDALKKRVLSCKPVLRAVLAWNEQDARRLVQAINERITAARPADYPSAPSRDWAQREFALEAAFVCKDMLAFIFAAQAHLNFALRGFETWYRLQHLMNREGR